MKKKLWIIAAIIVAVILGIGIWIYIRNNSEYFNGSRVKNPDCYTMDFTYMNQDDEHTMHLKAGDSLKVEYEITKGDIDVCIGISGEEAIYSGNDIETAQFELPISKEGDYVISVHAKRAEGKMYFYVEEG